MTAHPPQLVSTEWLAEHLSAPDIRVVDASWYMPDEQRDPRTEYEAVHIPGALFFDIDEISDTMSELPHMAPPVEKFISRMRRMGIGDGHRVIVYDAEGVFSAPRVWWLFRHFGKEDVAVLDGGLRKWRKEGRSVESGLPAARDRHFTARRNAALVRDVTQVARAAKLGDEQIVDARSPSRFRGEEDEPRAGLRAGHIPGSLNVHFRTLLNDDLTLKDKAGLRAAFETAGVDLQRPVITSCGSGITACILALGLDILGVRRVSVYDGSWVEWGAYPDLKVATG